MITRIGLAVACALVGSAAIALPLVAQEAPPQQQQPAFPEFNAVVKDMIAQPGLMTLYRFKPDDPTKDQTQLLALIPKNLLRQDILLATSISRGEMAGFQWNDYLIRFEPVGRRVLISVPDSRFVEQPGQPVTDAVTRTYTPTFLAALPIVTFTPQGDPLVDMTPLLMSRNANVPGMAGGEPRRDLSRYNAVKVFPDNILIDVDLALANRTGMGATTGIAYAFRRLPELRGYSPRVADERIGYFTTVRQDWNLKHSDRENIVRVVNRWNLKKKDPSLELSPPEKPIVFIIEKTVPLQWRRFVREGIEEWNKAFEQIGFSGAIQVFQQTDDNEFATIDPEDARYNFIRWIVTGRAFAMGPSRADPRTGQILDADIIFDDSMLRYFFRDYDVFGPRPVTAVAGPELTQFLLDNPSFIPMGMNASQLRADAEAAPGELLRAITVDAARDAGSNRIVPSNVSMQKFFQTQCNYAAGLEHQLSMMHSILLAQGQRAIPERYIGQVIKDIIAHEVGHTLGLRHNFKASSWLSVEELKRRRNESNDPTTASVMDYNALLFFAGDAIDKIRNVTSPTVGPYDVWAIEYGYRQPAQGENEKDMLAKIASQSAKREYAYSTDEDTMGLSSPDPLTARWDMSDNPIEWTRSRIELSDALLKEADKWARDKNDPQHYLREYVGTLLFEKTRGMMEVSRMVSGQYYNRSRAGDPDAPAPLVLIDPKLQREALKLMGETLFDDNFLRLPPEMLNSLTPSRWWDWTNEAAPRIDFPVHQVILARQSFALLNIASPTALQRVYDAELKSGADDKFTAAELIATTRQLVWGNLSLSEGDTYSDAKPMISSTRRNLQMQHLQFLLASADAPTGALMSADLQNMVRYSLRELSRDISRLMESGKVASGSKLDFGTRAHLSEVQSRIDRVLNTPVVTPGQSGMRTGMERGQ